MVFRAMLVAIVWAAAAIQGLQAQSPGDTTRYQTLRWRNIGPFRGGRADAVAGVPERPGTFYFGGTGGGVWKTEDAGLTWRNVSDRFFKTGSVGAIAVAPSDPNVVYVGMGEHPVRGVTTSHGDGVYRSTDQGVTWTHVGLEGTRAISRIRVHPRTPDLVYVAAQGAPYGPSAERGIYRSRDGGASWQRIHFVSEDAGASDLAMDPTNPRVLYAAYWDHRRLPWQVRSGGPGSGLWKSVDGGDTWTKLDTGLPKLMGKVGVSVSAVDPNLVWAIIEAEDGGLYRSDDAGTTWRRTSDDRLLRARAWYYTEVYADPANRETVYVLNAPITRSIDGGRTFQQLRIPHGDTHDLWINPADNRVMILADDGGATVTTNGGATWSSQDNQPTAQFYRVSTDHRFPYWLYGGQQDNSSVAIKSANPGGPGITGKDWFEGPGCESAYVAFDPGRPRYLYGGCYQGILSELDTETGYQRDIMAYPSQNLAADPRDQKYRFNWNAPLITSPHDPAVLYHGANVLLRSSDRGNTWRAISPDLTRNDRAKQGPGGAPITNEGAGGEVYGTIFTVAESPRQAGLLWVGSDDGLVQLSRDGGATWANVTPRDLPESQINAIEASPHDPGTAYLAVTRYKFNDFTPMAFRTRDFGKTWTRITAGLPAGGWVRVVREDPARRGLLFAGTETGIFVSFDDGERWQSLQLGLPVVPVTDLKVQGSDLVAATQGRAFWILDDISLLRAPETAGPAPSAPAVVAPERVYRVPGASGFAPNVPGVAANPPGGATIHFFLPAAPDSATRVTLEILDGEGRVVRTAVNRREKSPDGEAIPADSIPMKAGMNRALWDLRHQGYTPILGLLSFGGTQGRLVLPGRYRVRLTAGGGDGGGTATDTIEVLPDPRWNHPAAAYAEQEAITGAVQARLAGLYAAVRRIRRVRDQVSAAVKRAEGRPEGKEIAAAGDSLAQRLARAEERLVQPKSKTFQDIINFPNRLDAQLLNLLGAVDGAEPPVTAGQRERFQDLEAEWGRERAAVDRLLGPELEAFNTLLREKNIPGVVGR